MKKSLKSYVSLLRIRQWYKNLVIFIAVVFSGNLFIPKLITENILGFISLCLISSATYIINDIKDRKADQLHPEKCLRPLASGDFGLTQAMLLFILIATVGFFISFTISIEFFILTIIIFCLSQLYTFFLKKIAFADILTIASLFVLRAVGGTIITQVMISPWLILCTFFLSLFLTTGKRFGEVMLTRSKTLTRKALAGYTKDICHHLLLIATTLLIIAYSLYSFFSEHPYIIFSLPFALYVVIYYLSLIEKGEKITRNPELVFKEIRLLVGVALWVLVVIGAVYGPTLLQRIL